MAKFQLSLVQNTIVKDNNIEQSKTLVIPFTNFNSNINVQDIDYHYFYLDYYQNDNLLENYNSSYNYSSNESFSLHKNSKAELHFSMSKYITLESKFVINPFANILKTGSIIQFKDNYNKIRYFWVNSISYKFTKLNIEYEFDCQDMFSYINTRKNNGYQITSDTVSLKTIDGWAEQIINECNVDYKYVKITEKYADDKEFLQTFNRLFIFEISNSNAYNALVSLGEQIGLILEVDEDDVDQKQFWFKPEKNRDYNGLQYSPYTNIKNFSLSQTGESLVSILNVFGQDTDYIQVSLLSDIPDKLILEGFSSDKWTNSKFYPGFYQDFTGPEYCGVWDYKNSNVVVDDQWRLIPNIDPKTNRFLTIVDKIPWLENKIINLEYFIENHLITNEQYQILWDKITNELRIINGKLLYYSHLYFSTKDESIKWQVTLEEAIQKYGADITTNLLIDINKMNNFNWNDITIDSAKQKLIQISYDALVDSFIHEPFEEQTRYDLNDRADLLSDYGTKLVRADQRFLLNLYNFLNYKFLNNTSWADHLNVESIETVDFCNLNMYWKAAVEASVFCNYFLPQDWTKIKCNYDHWEDIFIVKKEISSEELVLYNEYEYITQTSSTIPEKDVAATKLLNNFAYNGECFIGKDTTQIDGDWYTLEKGITWNDFKAKWQAPDFEENQQINYFYGIYPLYLQLLIYGFKENTVSFVENNKVISLKEKYEEYETLHRQKWNEIYNQFGSFILEGAYNDATAIDSLELYNNASNYFKDLSKPEYQYDLSIININSLKGYKGEKLDISDQIHLAADEFYEESDDLKNVIKQPLFITDISYNLRSDEDIKLTVNAIKYQDKVIQRLISLIK